MFQTGKGIADDISMGTGVNHPIVFVIPSKGPGLCFRGGQERYGGRQESALRGARAGKGGAG